MHSKKTIKLISSLVVIIVFVTVLASGGTQKSGELKSPKLLPISASVANSAMVSGTLPVSDVMPSAVTGPTVTTATPTLKLTSVPPLYYVFNVFDVVDGRVSSVPNPSFSSSYIQARGTETLYTVKSPLVGGSSYAWTAIACAADYSVTRLSGTPNCSDPAELSYFTVNLSVVDVIDSVSMYITLDTGEVRTWNGSAWVPSGDQSPVATIAPADMPTIYITDEDGTVKMWNGTEFIPVPGDQTFLEEVGSVLLEGIEVLGGWVDEGVEWVIDVFTADVTPVLPEIFSTRSDGAILKFDPSIGVSGDWVEVSPATTTVTGEVIFFSSTLDGTVFRFDDTTNRWAPASDSSRTNIINEQNIVSPSIPVSAPVVEPAPSGFMSLPIMQWLFY